MEKVIKIGDYEIPLRSTAASLISYKANFGRDGLRDMLALSRDLPREGGVTADSLAESGFDLDVFYRFLWVFARSADKSIPPLEHWLDGFDIAPLDFAFAALPAIMELLAGVKTSVAQKNPQAAAAKAKSRPN